MSVHGLIPLVLGGGGLLLLLALPLLISSLLLPVPLVGVVWQHHF